MTRYHYRVYFLSAAGQFTGTQFIDAPNDREAVKKGRQLLDVQDVEVWDDGQLVARIAHDRPWVGDR